ncbi:response regulator [Pseudobdellovibrio sp. HCB154]|uniref:response regulator n=1 Tax=Pseudobdellovibrio sp. HCB154 TaxID=3386277 RepID=UPI0039172BAF
MGPIKEKAQILIIEDEPAIAELIALTLREFDAQIEKTFSAEQAIFLLQNKSYDLILADWMLPGLQGIDLVTAVKNKNRDQLILMITAKADPDSIVRGLEAGADDYVSKPFDPRVLAARVKNLLRRKQAEPQAQQVLGSTEVVELDGLKYDYGRVEVTLKQNPIHLTPSEFKLLGFLLKSQGRVLTRDQLIDLIQGEDVSVTGRTIDTHVFALRKKLLEWAEHIETIRGVGYRVNYSI